MIFILAWTWTESRWKYVVMGAAAALACGVRPTALLLLPAFAAGAWSEHISFTMLMVLFLLTVWDWIRNRSPHPVTSTYISGHRRKGSPEPYYR